jgi:hypothetical protein
MGKIEPLSYRMPTCAIRATEQPDYGNTGGRVRYREYHVMTAAGNSVHDVLRLLRISQPRSCHAKAPEKIAG